MADNHEPGNTPSNISNIFEKFGKPAEPSGQLEGIQSALKSLADSMTEMRSEVNSLRRSAEIETPEEYSNSKCFCTEDESCSDNVSVGSFFTESGAPDRDEDEFGIKDFFEDEVETGAALGDELATWSNKALQVKPKEEKLKEIFNQHKRPINVDFLQVPLVNEQLWQQLPPQVKAHDFLLQKTQKNYSSALVPVMKAMDVLNLKKKGKSKLKGLVGDTFKILTNAFVTTSQVRRDRIKKELLPKYRPVCRAEPSATHLFGDKVEDELKKLKDSKQQLTSRRPFLGKRQGMANLVSQQRRQHAFGLPGNMNANQQRQRQQQNYRTKLQKKNFNQSRAQKK